MSDPSPSVSSQSRSVIPLFPLGAVLFPGVVLPLHIFEPRYRLLVRRLMAPEASREFGVVAIRQGVETGEHGATALYDVGCAAELRQVTPYDDGRFDIVAVGHRRFRLLDIDAGTEPYLSGTVEWLPERPTEPSESIVVARSVAELYLRCRELLRAHEPDQRAAPGNSSAADGPSTAEGKSDADRAPAAEGSSAPERAEGVSATRGLGLDEPIHLPDDPLLLSHLVAASAPFTLDDRQSLLSAANTAERLRQELRLLKQEVTMLSRLRAVPVPLAQLRVPMGMN